MTVYVTRRGTTPLLITSAHLKIPFVTSIAKLGFGLQSAVKLVEFHVVAERGSHELPAKQQTHS